jgi:hypothetical protein
MHVLKNSRVNTAIVKMLLRLIGGVSTQHMLSLATVLKRLRPENPRNDVDATWTNYATCGSKYSGGFAEGSSSLESSAEPSAKMSPSNFWKPAYLTVNESIKGSIDQVCCEFFSFQVVRSLDLCF